MYLTSRHIGTSTEEQKQMLQSIGAESLSHLIEQTLPKDIILPESAPSNEPISEQQHISDMAELATQNTICSNFIGQGYYQTTTPAVIQRCVLENPVWYTSYTPYQAEISQGRLEALFTFQTLVSDMTCLPLANCSLLDEATAAAEAVTMMRNLRSREQQKNNIHKVLVDSCIFPQTLAVLKTRAAGQNIQLVIKDHSLWTKELSTKQYFGVLLQYPNSNGQIEDYSYITAAAHGNGAKVAVIADLLALALIQSPAKWGVDIICGHTQRFGLPMAFGGPTVGYMATKEEYKRDIPGRIIGRSKDQYDKPAYRLALQTREQHIKREKATSNICTAEALYAMISGFYAVYHGPQGIRKIAQDIHSQATYLNEMLQAYGFNQINSVFFDTLAIEVTKRQLQRIKKLAEKRNINLFYDDKNNRIYLSIGEDTTLEQMNNLIEIFAIASDNFPQVESSIDAFANLWTIPEEIQRPIDYLSAPVFNLYHSETELMRYIKQLELKDISLTESMIPLGSCTMKLNPASAMIPITYPGFTNIHPLQPASQVKGYMTIIQELKQQLCHITGFSACTLQPTSGAAGEYTGLVVIRAALKHKKEFARKILLIPSSAHGTNPASCVQAGFTPVVVECDSNGNTDLNDWTQKAQQYSNELAGCMITYPSTHGIFEADIKRMCQVIHENGGYVYMDGANMNAQICYTSPAYIGADVCHLNLHKSFAAPHGGGGPGAGAVCCTKELQRFLPSLANNRVSTAAYGNINIALISYGYIRMMGFEGLRAATANAILNANYLACKLKEAYGIVYTGANNRVGHELILDCRQFHQYGITESDVAKRLMDYGYHAPTLSFPVHGTLMIEPTESESKAELDRFVEVMLQIRAEIQEIIDGKADKTDNVLVNAPHPLYEITADDWQHSYSRQKAAYPLAFLYEKKYFTPVARVDNGYGDRNLIARFK